MMRHYNIEQEPPEIFYRKGILKICKIQKKTPVSEPFFNKVPGFRQRF